LLCIFFSLFGKVEGRRSAQHPAGYESKTALSTEDAAAGDRTLQVSVNRVWRKLQSTPKSREKRKEVVEEEEVSEVKDEERREGSMG
jgi:hypothetical protein